MTTLTGSNVAMPTYQGEHGNLSVYEGSYSNRARMNGPVEIDLFTVPAGVKPLSARIAWNILTSNFTGQQIKLGWKYKSPAYSGGASDAVFPAQTFASSVAQHDIGKGFVPEVFTAMGASGNGTGILDNDIVIYATVINGADIGDFDIHASLTGIYTGAG